jgi:hypothetical protein
MEQNKQIKHVEIDYDKPTFSTEEIIDIMKYVSRQVILLLFVSRGLGYWFF